MNSLISIVVFLVTVSLVLVWYARKRLCNERRLRTNAPQRRLAESIVIPTKSDHEAPLAQPQPLSQPAGEADPGTVLSGTPQASVADGEQQPFHDRLMPECGPGKGGLDVNEPRTSQAAAPSGAVVSTADIPAQGVQPKSLPVGISSDRPRAVTDEVVSDVDLAYEDAEETTEPDHVKPPTYQAPAAPPSTAPARPHSPTHARQVSSTSTDLRLRLQLVFSRSGDVRKLALVPDRQPGMPDQVEIRGTQGRLQFFEAGDERYESVPIIDPSRALEQGIEWRGTGDVRGWRWVLGGRELYVLVPGDEFGLHGFISTTRLRLNTRHVVLASVRLRDEIVNALAEAGCKRPDADEDTSRGVPCGWVLFRNVTPTCSLPMRTEAHILNVLCPLPDVEPHFIGGLRLERQTWLTGFPPRIQFTGALGDGLRVMIDGHTAQRAGNGAFEAPGWDSDGEHRLWFEDKVETYTLRTMEEKWAFWDAYNFGTGAAICGAAIHQLTEVRWRQVGVLTTNPLLIGARPSEVFYCQLRKDLRCETILTQAPFTPVWALPIDPWHADKQSACIALLNPAEPVVDIRLPSGRGASHPFVPWISAIHAARCKGLVLNPDTEEGRSLWRRYGLAAKQLRRRMR